MTFNLQAKTRKTFGKKVNKLREAGQVPAVMYGPETEPVALAVDYVELEKVYNEAGESTLINLKIDDKEEVPVLIHDVSYHPVYEKIDHVDFYKIKYGQKLTANVELNFVGESRAVRELGGILVTNLEEVEVECLPRDLIGEIEVDLSQLKEIDDVIYVKDLKVPETIKILNDPEEVVASVTTAKMEEETPQEEAPAEESSQEEKKETKQESSEEKKEEK